MNGLELVSAIVDQYPQVPVILMTGKGSEDIAVKALQAGAASYVPKTALHHLLVETVTDVLAMTRDPSRQRLMECLRTDASRFCSNDADMIPTLISYVQSIVISIGLCDEADVIQVCIALKKLFAMPCSTATWKLPRAARRRRYLCRTRPPYLKRSLAKPSPARATGHLASVRRSMFGTKVPVLTRPSCLTRPTPPISKKSADAACS